MRTVIGERKPLYWIALIAAVILLAALVYIRQILAGWLLPDGRYLDAIAQRLQYGDEQIAEAVFSQLQGWVIDD